jgi:hypothetical protein
MALCPAAKSGDGATAGDVPRRGGGRLRVCVCGEEGVCVGGMGAAVGGWLVLGQWLSSFFFF